MHLKKKEDLTSFVSGTFSRSFSIKSVFQGILKGTDIFLICVDRENLKNQAYHPVLSLPVRDRTGLVSLNEKLLHNHFQMPSQVGYASNSHKISG